MTFTLCFCSNHAHLTTMASQMLGALICLLLVSLGQAQDPLRYTITEESTDSFVGDLIEDAGLNQQYTQSELDRISFVFVESDDAYENLFRVNRGILETKAPVDRDNICPHLEICVLHVAIKLQPSEFFAIIQTEVVIVDLNDNTPRFQPRSQEVTISESKAVGSLSDMPQAIDNDGPPFSIEVYEMSPESQYFALYQETVNGIVQVQLEVLQELDREEQDEYTFTLVAYDGGDPVQSSSADITITISDSNDNRPVFSQTEYEVSVPENLSAGFSIIRVTATDRDVGTNAEITYSFDDNTDSESAHLFRLDSQTGQVYLREMLDFESQTQHILTILAKDNYPEFAGAVAEVTVNVVDINDNKPSIKINDLEEGETLEVPENASKEHFVAHLTVVDADSGNNGVFDCTIDDSNFVLERLYPTEFKIITDVVFDRETRSQYTIRMSCQDNGSPQQRSILTIPVIISDENDQDPIFHSSTFVGKTSEDSIPGSFIMRVSATDQDIGPNGEIEYHIDGAMMDLFNIGILSGNISAKVILDHERQNRYTFTVTAIDRGTPRRSSSATVIIDIDDVDDNVPVFNMNSYTFSVLENELPPAEVGTVTATDADSEPFNHFQYAMQSSDIFRIDNDTGAIYTKVALDREALITPVFTTKVFAISTGSRQATSTALVTVHIADINDHAPVITFPNLQNNTLYTTNTLRHGEVVGYVQANDIDDGSNARLTYSFLSGNQENYFLIDAADGTIRAHRDLSSVDTKAFGLIVRVRDGGHPPEDDEAFLNIVVNKSVGSEADDSRKKTNLSIVISIACISGCVIVILMIAIAFIILQRRRQRTLYNNVPKVLNNDPFLQISHTAPTQEKPSNQLAPSYDNSGYADESTFEKNDPQQYYKQNEHVPRDADQDSACSADLSNTDSGRGSNEDCSHDKIRQQQDEFQIVQNVPPVRPYNPHTDRKHSVDSANFSQRYHRSRNASESAINVPDRRHIQTAHLQSGAYAPRDRDYQSRRSFNAKNISHPSPILDDPIYGDRRRNVLYRDMSHSPGRLSNALNTSLQSSVQDPGVNPDYVRLNGIGPSKGVLHEVHV